MAIKIFLDIGHGGKDPGAVAYGLQEKVIVLNIGLRMKQILTSEYDNVAVKLSRESDIYLTLFERARMANAWGADFFLSLHVNAGGGTGFESYVHSSRPSRAVAYQNVIHSEVLKAVGVTNRGKKARNFAVLRETSMPALLTENMFIDTASDAALLKDTTFLEKLARGHVNGLEKALGIKKRTWSDENSMLKNAIIINSYADFPSAEGLARRLKAPIFIAGTVEGKIAENVFIVGGGSAGIQAGKLVNLSGRNRFETSQKVGKYLEVL